MYSVGVDIGGMSVKIGLVNDNGQILSIKKVKTNKNQDLLVGGVANAINEILGNAKLDLSKIKGIGIGCPGSVSGDKGVVDFLPNLGWVNVPLSQMLQDKLGYNVPIKIANDADVAILAEVLFGAAKGYTNAVMFTLGTGRWRWCRY